MAALSLLAQSSLMRTNHKMASIQGLKSRNCSSNPVRCQRGEPMMMSSSAKEKKEMKEEKQLIPARQIYNSSDKGLKDTLTPKQKGDWKDIVLMSLAFGVYVYISQQIVCAYCAWHSMLKHPF